MTEIRLIDANALKEEVENLIGYSLSYEAILNAIDNAPTIDFDYLIKNAPDVIQYDGDSGRITTRPQDKREFIEILTEYREDDICPYPEYKGKPYYAIHYIENGEEFVGYGTYNPAVLSRYLRDYFFEADIGDKR